MVASHVPSIERVITLNFARAYLFRAADALNRGDLIGAGCLLREAIRRQCYAECEWFGCMPISPSERMPPVTLLKSLKKDSRCGKDDWGYDLIKEMIDLANAAAHCKPVSAKLMRSSIEVFHGVIDAEPCLQPANMPGKAKPTLPLFQDCDCDDVDDDGSNWWKPADWTPQL